MATTPDPRAAQSLLLVVDGRFEHHLLERAALVAQAFDLGVVVYRPEPESSPASESAAGRERLGEWVAKLEQRGVAASARTTVCGSATTGALDQAAEIEPPIVMLPGPTMEDAVPQPLVIDYETFWAQSPAPAWIVARSAAKSDNVLGMIALESEERARASADEAVAAAEARCARRLEGAAHLVHCAHRPSALSSAMEAIAPPPVSASERREDAAMRRLHELATRSAIPIDHVHLHRGAPEVVVAEMIEPMGVGLIVTTPRSNGLLGRFLHQGSAEKLVELDCDVLVLGPARARASSEKL